MKHPALSTTVLLAIAACGYPRPGDIGDAPRPVTGRVHGLWDGRGDAGVGLRLESDGVDTALTLAANGAFEFTRPIDPGAAYRVTVTASPPRHTCTVAAGGQGDGQTSGGEPTLPAVSIACVGPIEGIAVSGPAGWVFDPSEDDQTLTGSVAIQSVALTITGGELATARIADADAVIGAPSAIALPLGPLAVPIAVTAGGGLSKTYQLTFDRGGAVLDQAVYGKASNTGFSDFFGWAMAASGDTLAVAASGEASATGDPANNAAGDAGAVYVFVRTGAVWTQQAYVKPKHPQLEDRFGWSIALSGDTLAVGAPDEDGGSSGVNGDELDDSAPSSGAVYVFTRSGGAWTQQAYLKASNTGVEDRFGTSVALSGDTLAIGAPGEDSSAKGVDPPEGGQNEGAPTSGAAYVFARTGSVWQQQAYVKSTATANGAQFGWSVAIAGDTLAVGAPFEAAGGSVYTYARSSLNWSTLIAVHAPNAQADDQFGTAVAMSGTTLVVAAPGEDSGATGVDGNQLDNSADGAGAVYAFTRAGPAWSPQGYFKASNTRRGMGFGRSVAVSGDVIAVGADDETSHARGVDGDGADDSTESAGAAYVFVREGTHWRREAYLKASNTGTFDRFGTSVAVAAGTIAVGAQTEGSSATGINPPGAAQNDSGASSSGAIYVFR